MYSNRFPHGMPPPGPNFRYPPMVANMRYPPYPNDQRLVNVYAWLDHSQYAVVSFLHV